MILEVLGGFSRILAVLVGFIYMDFKALSGILKILAVLVGFWRSYQDLIKM